MIGQVKDRAIAELNLLNNAVAVRCKVVLEQYAMAVLQFKQERAFPERSIHSSAADTIQIEHCGNIAQNQTIHVSAIAAIVVLNNHILAILGFDIIGIGPFTAKHDITAGTAKQRIITNTAYERIIAGTTHEGIIARTAIDPVVEIVTGYSVIP